MEEVLVELVLHGLVPVEDVVGAGDVLGVVLARAAASDGVVDLPRRALVVGEVLEEELGPVRPAAILEVLDLGHVGLHDLVRVLGVPAVEEHRHRDGLVGEPVVEHFAVIVVDLRQEQLLDLVLRERLSAIAPVVQPLRLLLESLQHVEDGPVVASVVLVQVGPAVVGEDVVDVAAPLGHGGLGLRPILSRVPARDDELLEVVVVDVLFRRDEVVTVRGPDVVDVVALGVLARVQ